MRTTTNNPSRISIEALAALGAPDLAYVKPVLENGVKRYAIHAGDGTPLALVDGRELAFAVALRNDYDPVSVH